MNYLISNNNLKVTIASLGAEPISIIKNGKERLWQNENGSWNRHAPILFPHAGKVNLIINGIKYESNQHGFLRDQKFELVNIKESKLTLKFKSNEETKKYYPYDFEFIAEYEIKESTLIIKYKINNLLDTPMYFMLGGHESFLLDKEVKNYYVLFEKEEDLISVDLNKPMNLGKSNKIDLSSSLLEDSGSIVLHNIKSREVSLYDKKDNSIIAKTRFDGFSNFLLWHSINSKMICMEPWINLPDNKDTINKEFKDKENVIKLEGKSSKEFIRTIYYY